MNWRQFHWRAILLCAAFVGSFSYVGLSLAFGYQAAKVKAAAASGRGHYERGEYEAAVRDLRFVVDRQPDFGAARYYLGRALYEHGKAQAKAQWREALSVLPPASPYQEKTRRELAASAKWP